jgi:uncharacterized protein YjdB
MRLPMRALRLVPLLAILAACHKDATGPAARATLFVSPSALTLTTGDSLGPGEVVRAQLQNPDGTTAPAGSVTWTSSDPAVVAVTGDNSIVARGAGFAVVTARSGSQRAELSVSVQDRQAATAFYITPAAVVLVPDGTATLQPNRVNADGSVATPTGVTYLSTDATVATVDAAGVVTAHALGAATIIARLGNQVATVAVSVQAVPVATVVLAPDTSVLTIGGSTTLAATTEDAAGSALANRFVSWSSSDPNIASVTSAGVVSANGVGVAQITATAEGKSAVATVRVTPLPTASLVLVPGTLTVNRFESGTLVARATDSGGAAADNPSGTVFTSADASIASVDAAGRVTGVAEGTVEVYATYDGKADTAVVTVAPARVVTVTIAPAAASLLRLDTLRLVATARDVNGFPITGRAVSWTTSNPAIATVSAAGDVAGESIGIAIIQATIDGVSGTSRIDVLRPRAVSVTLTPDPVSLVEGDSVRFTATAYDKLGAPIPGKVFLWSTSNPGALAIDNAGLARALDARAGTVVVTASTDGIPATATVTLQLPPIATILLSPTSFNLTVGSSARIDAVARDASFRVLPGPFALTWSTSNPAVATVDATGRVTATGVGVAAITATSSNGVASSASVTVTP